ncbi:MAG: hypothetical protein HQ472_02770 [Ignavibacteria bacterium]|nr:hypothetical protein [Ignavibacteria bacterium]
MSLVVLLVATSGQVKSQSFKDELLPIIAPVFKSVGIDSTGHWWAIIKPFETGINIMVDGDLYGPYDAIDPPIFSVDGTSWAFAAERNRQYRIVTESDSIVSQSAIQNLAYKFRSNQLFWQEQNGSDKRIVSRSKTYFIQTEVLAKHTDLTGGVVCWTEAAQRGTILYSNGSIVGSADSIQLVGVWYNGEPLYARLNGTRWSVLIGSREIYNGLNSVREFQMNTSADVCAWISDLGNVGTKAFMYKDDFAEPWEGPVLNSVSKLVLSPTDGLVAYMGLFGSQLSVYFNSAAYPAGRETGYPFFTNNGEFMVYSGFDGDQFVAINGKKIRIKSSAPKSRGFAVTPNGEVACWSSQSTIVLADLEFNFIQMGKMCDDVTDAVYHRPSNTFMALGKVSNRLYLLTAIPR